MLAMNYESATGKARDLGDKIVELAARLARPHQAVAEDILFADDGDVIGFKTGLHAEHGQHRFIARGSLPRAPAVDAGEVQKFVIPQHAAHAIAQALAPQRAQDFLAL